MTTFHPGDRVIVHPPPHRKTGRTYTAWKGTVRSVWPGTLWIVKDEDPVPALQGHAAYNVHPAHVRHRAPLRPAAIRAGPDKIPAQIG